MLLNPKGNQSWIFIGKTDTEAETPVFWPPDAKSWLVGKDPDAGKDWGQEEKRVTEDEMVEWHHQLNGHECEQTLGDSEGHGRLACCSPWGCKESNTTLVIEQQCFFTSASTLICMINCPLSLTQGNTT